MSLLGMPYAFINLGCQMLYVLHQRLGAQGIPPDKGAKVLHDLVATMFEPAFLADKLFVPQDMYSLLSTRKVFDKIAHSSIMKLSSNRCAGVVVGGGWRRGVAAVETLTSADTACCASPACLPLPARAYTQHGKTV